MRVAHIHRIGGIGGSERHLLTLLPALAARGIGVRMIGLDNPAAAPDPFYADLERHGVEYHRIPCPRDLDPMLARRVRRTVKALRPDIVHTHLVHADVYGSLGARGSRATLVTTKHNDDPFRRGAFRHVERLITRRAARVICITGALARFCVESVGLPEEKVSVVHYGLDDPPAAWDGPAGPHLPDDARVLVAVCRLDDQKGLDVAIAALAQVRERHPGTVLVVLGEGPLRDELTARARRHDVADALFLPGRVGDVTRWLRRAEVVVHPARWEGFGLALLEAMLCARPLVASSVSAIPEIVVDGGTGLLVPPDDVAALAGAITELLDDPDRAARLGAAGLERAHALFSVAAMTEKTLAVYRAVLASPSAR